MFSSTERGLQNKRVIFLRVIISKGFAPSIHIEGCESIAILAEAFQAIVLRAECLRALLGKSFELLNDRGLRLHPPPRRKCCPHQDGLLVFKHDQERQTQGLGDRQDAEDHLHFQDKQVIPRRGMRPPQEQNASSHRLHDVRRPS